MPLAIPSRFAYVLVVLSALVPFAPRVARADVRVAIDDFVGPQAERARRAATRSLVSLSEVRTTTRARADVVLSGRTNGRGANAMVELRAHDRSGNLIGSSRVPIRSRARMRRSLRRLLGVRSTTRPARARRPARRSARRARRRQPELPNRLPGKPTNARARSLPRSSAPAVAGRIGTFDMTDGNRHQNTIAYPELGAFVTVRPWVHDTDFARRRPVPRPLRARGRSSGAQHAHRRARRRAVLSVSFRRGVAARRRLRGRARGGGRFRLAGIQFRGAGARRRPERGVRVSSPGRPRARRPARRALGLGHRGRLPRSSLPRSALGRTLEKRARPRASTSSRPSADSSTSACRTRSKRASSATFTSSRAKRSAAPGRTVGTSGCGWSPHRLRDRLTHG